MPKSKRQKLVHTSTLTKKPSKEKSAALFAAVREALQHYQTHLLFRISNMRNTYLKDLRQEFQADGRLFFGKTKVMAKALGTSAEEEFLPGLAALAGHMRGDVGLLCTNRGVEETLEFLEGYVEMDFARAGVVAPRRFVVPAGVVYSTAGEQPVEDDVPLPHSLEAQVRKWGMPTRLDKGKVTLDQDHVVCEEGKVLNSNQTALLKTFGVVMAEFRVKVLAYWTADTEKVTVVEEGEDMEED